MDPKYPAKSPWDTLGWALVILLLVLATLDGLRDAL